MVSPRRLLLLSGTTTTALLLSAPLLCDASALDDFRRQCSGPFLFLDAMNLDHHIYRPPPDKFRHGMRITTPPTSSPGAPTLPRLLGGRSPHAMVLHVNTR